MNMVLIALTGILSPLRIKPFCKDIFLLYWYLVNFNNIIFAAYEFLEVRCGQVFDMISCSHEAKEIKEGFMF